MHFLSICRNIQLLIFHPITCKAEMCDKKLRMKEDSRELVVLNFCVMYRMSEIWSLISLTILQTSIMSVNRCQNLFLQYPFKLPNDSN